MPLLIASLLLLFQAGEDRPAEPPSPVRIEQGSLLVMTPDSALGALEKELVQLHLALRPAMVRVEIPVPRLGGAVPAGDGVGDGQEPLERVLVSGVVIDRGGLFVAPGPLLGPLQAVRAVRFDGEVFEAEPVEREEVFGLTLFRAPELGVPPPPLAWPASLRVGSVTVSLGNAFGLSGSLDLGFVAGLNRRVEDVEGLIQITNTVNPGDGGGLVANRHGQVIGLIKTSLREVGQRQLEAGCPDDCTDGCEELVRSESLSFAVPIDRVLLAFQEHLSFPVPDQQWLGVLVRERYLPELAAGMRRPATTFLVLDRVLPESPAVDAGLRPGDVLVEMGGVPLVDLNGLKQALFAARAGQEVEVAFLREGQPRVARLQLGWRPPKGWRQTPPRD